MTYAILVFRECFLLADKKQRSVLVPISLSLMMSIYLASTFKLLLRSIPSLDEDL